MSVVASVVGWRWTPFFAITAGAFLFVLVVEVTVATAMDASVAEDGGTIESADIVGAPPIDLPTGPVEPRSVAPRRLAGSTPPSPEIAPPPVAPLAPPVMPPPPPPPIEPETNALLTTPPPPLPPPVVPPPPADVDESEEGEDEAVDDGAEEEAAPPPARGRAGVIVTRPQLFKRMTPGHPPEPAPAPEEVVPEE